MDRYITFIMWAAAFFLGGWIVGNPVSKGVPLSLAMLWGCMLTNWMYGTYNPTGLPCFNPQPKSSEEN